MEGILASGKPLHGQHPNSTDVEGADAACVKCHRRSGLGGLEGNIVAPPITGSFLFANKDNRPVALLDTRSPKDVTRAHTAYNPDTLSKAIREGINISGKKLNPLMPRYNLNSSEIKALTAYLKELSAKLSPGVDTDKVHFATIITPDADPTHRDILINMMNAAFKQRNASQLVSAGRMRMPIDLIPRTKRDWELAVWELKGPPDTWQKQLEDFYHQQPVFAVISGLAGSTWEPVDAFCEHEKLPCILPSIPLPPEKLGFYPIYFSRGLALEADVLAKHLKDQTTKTPERLIQIYRNNEVGQAAAKTLTQALKDSKVKVEDRIFPDSNEFSNLLDQLTDKDEVILWLNSSDLGLLNKVAIKQITYISGFLTHEKYDLLPKNWQPNLRIVYPYELGEKRRANLVQLNGWLKTWHIQLVDEAFQSEVFFNLLLLTDLSSQMLDNLHRDYLVERIEDMLSVGTNSSAYPHLSLAPGQRFASKGAYIAGVDKNGKLVTESEWIVP